MPSWSRAILMKSWPTSLLNVFFRWSASRNRISGGQQRPGRDLLGDVGRREIAQVEIVALQRDQLGALLEQRVAPVRLEIEVVLDRGGEGLVGLGAKIGFGERAAEAQLRSCSARLRLRRSERERDSARRHQRAAGDLRSCVVLPDSRSHSRCARPAIASREYANQ